MAENASLSLANESQREAYERCLDEVSNHVVQALLNQKDLREECIKLKMRVFHLERQNGALTELLAQKLHAQSISLPQLQLLSFQEHSPEPLTIGSKKLLLTQIQGDFKNNVDRIQNRTAGSARAPGNSMEAMSPFFKKKAQILEAMRQLEESDPLKFHSTCLFHHSDLGQALVSMERDQLSPGGLIAPQRPIGNILSRCRHSSSNSDIQDYTNGEGAIQENRDLQQQNKGCQLCLSQKSNLLNCAQGHGAAQPSRVECLNGQAWEEDQGASAQGSGPPQASAVPNPLSADSTIQCCMHKTSMVSLKHPSECLGSPDSFISSLIQANVIGMLAEEPRKAQRRKGKHLSGKLLLPPRIHESGNKSSATSSSISKGEKEALFTTRIYVAKAEGPKIKMGTSSSNTETPSVVSSYGKCSITQSNQIKTAPSLQNSPTKVPIKSPSKVGQASSYPRGVKPIHEDCAPAQRHQSRPEDKSKVNIGKQCFVHAESLPAPPLPPRLSTDSTAKVDKKPYPSVWPVPHSAMEQKVMKLCPSGPPVSHSAMEQKVMRGIEENMLKLQELDRGQGADPKQKTSNGIASWFGLGKSKLPALSRKPEGSKMKINMSASPSSCSGEVARKVVESLNISKLMEKAEDFQKALDEEQAYVDRVGMECSGMDTGQLALVYRGVTTDNFMQHLLNSPSTSYYGNKVDERGAMPALLGMAHRRLSFDSKKSKAIFTHQRNGISHTKSRDEMNQGSVMIGKDKVTSDESFAYESISSQHFTGSGASMRTLDSGIGTFPMPDYASSAAGKSIPKGKLQGLEGRGLNDHMSSNIHEDMDAYGAQMQNPPTKNWTFPNLKGSTGPTDVYLDMQGEPGNQGTPSRRSLKQCTPQGPLATESGQLPPPHQAGFCWQGKGWTPTDVGKDVGLEQVKERTEDILSPKETAESMSDSLYDSLSSCGSQSEEVLTSPY
ncbi:hypothetical protein DPEC_G00213910 [Dallia pectoralis]|uniref:Uncharacterized protein n=1 Tax=Dallia pectoralis TaxID=75939 RepID=A0ACC2G6S2_DALPE|nr:hypothetical protein DPEC_G00213910 [Dallia pectoralis]